MASFERSATKMNANRNFQKPVTGKSVQDRFKKLLVSFHSRALTVRMRPGTGGGIGELDGLLEDM